MCASAIGSFGNTAIKPLDVLSLFHVFNSDAVPGLLLLAVRMWIVLQSQEGGDLAGWAVLQCYVKLEGGIFRCHIYEQDFSCWILGKTGNITKSHELLVVVVLSAAFEPSCFGDGVAGKGIGRLLPRRRLRLSLLPWTRPFTLLIISLPLFSIFQV